MIALGQTVGNYRVTSKLGEGGMGSVYLAEHPVIGRKVALKVVHPEYARNADYLGRFVNEATAINLIGHPHIVEVTDFGSTPEGDSYFVMEHLDGLSLAEVIEREAPLAPARALAIADQIADALASSHAHGVIHRDLKPENVFLVTRGQDVSFVKVLDFGLAKLVESGVSTHDTLAGVVMGTPLYMAPEQCEGRSELDHRADIYALGVVLFEMLTGKVPFGGATSGEVLMQHLTARAPDASSLVSGLPAALDVVLHRALAKDPAERFATMEEFRAALATPEACEPTRDERITLDLAGALEEAPARTSRRRGRHGVAFVAAALAFVAIFAGPTYARLPRPAPAVAPVAAPAPVAVAAEPSAPSAVPRVEVPDDDPPARRAPTAVSHRRAAPQSPLGLDEDDILPLSLD